MSHPFSPVVGVICELNPLHNGHVYLLSEARRLAGDQGCVICVMSGRCTQRGELAILEPFKRGRMALIGGADLVLELPFPWSSGSSEIFAKAGVHILSSVGADHLIFGSECGDMHLLSRCADLIGSPEFSVKYATACGEGRGTAAAYVQTLTEMAKDNGIICPKDFPSSNDLLGLAYVSAIKALEVHMIPHTVKRQGQDYRDDILTNTDFPSATSLRYLIREAAEDLSALQAMLDHTMPPEALELLLQEIAARRAPIDMTPLYTYYHTYFRLYDTEERQPSAEIGGGLAGHLCKCAKGAATSEAFMAEIATKQYTYARLKRGLLFAVTGVTENDLTSLPVYTQLLAANSLGKQYLSNARKQGTAVTVVTKSADAPEGRQKQLTNTIDALVTLCLPQAEEAGWLLKKNAFSEK